VRTYVGSYDGNCDVSVRPIVEAPSRKRRRNTSRGDEPWLRESESDASTRRTDHRLTSGLRNIGGTNTNGTRWRLTETEAIKTTEDGTYSFYVERPAGHVVGVVVAQRLGHKYLKTAADGDSLTTSSHCPSALRRPAPSNQIEHEEGGEDMPTGKKASSDAGKVLSDPKATPAEKSAAASDLAPNTEAGQQQEVAVSASLDRARACD